MSKHKKTNHDLMIDEEVIDVEFNDLFNNGDYDLEEVSELYLEMKDVTLVWNDTHLW